MKLISKSILIFSLLFLVSCSSLKVDSDLQSKEEIKLEELNSDFVTYITTNKIDLEKLYNYQNKYEGFLKELESVGNSLDNSKEIKITVNKNELSAKEEIDIFIKLVKNRLIVIEDLKN